MTHKAWIGAGVVLRVIAFLAVAYCAGRLWRTTRDLLQDNARHQAQGAAEESLIFAWSGAYEMTCALMTGETRTYRMLEPKPSTLHVQPMWSCDVRSGDLVGVSVVRRTAADEGA